jgi:PAS domain S-box-containing protein
MATSAQWRGEQWRILVLLPTTKDTERTTRILATVGLLGVACRDMAEVLQKLETEVGAVLLTEEELLLDKEGRLAQALRAQPPWSAVPLVMLASGGNDARREKLLAGVSANVTQVERPIRVRTLLSALQAALRARRHQYEIRDALAEQVRQREALRASEERYRSLIEVSPQIVWIGRDDGGSTFCNQQWFDLTGLTAEESLGSGWAKAIHPAHRDRVHTLWVDAVARAGSFEAEIPFRRAADGQYRWHLAKAVPIQAADGRSAHWLGVATDIHDRKEAQERERRVTAEAAAANAKFRSFFEQCPFYAGIMTVEGTLIDISRSALVDCGYAPADVLGQKFWETSWWRDAADIQERLRRGVATAAAGRPYRDELPYRLKDGTVRCTDFALSPIVDDAGRVSFLVPVWIDITERKHAEQATQLLATVSTSLGELADTRSTLQQVATQVVPKFADWCAVDLLDEQGSCERLIVANSDASKARLACELIEKYQPSPQSRHGVGRVLREGQSELIQEVADDNLRGLSRSPEHLQLLRELGIRSHLCVPLVSREQTLGAFTFVTAESGRRYSPKDLQVAEDLARRATVAIENADLYRARKEADRRKDEFLATLAHELRNPLAPVRTGLHLLRVTPPGEAAEAVREMMDRQLAHMVRLIDDLLDVSRITSGKVELKRERCTLQLVLEAAIEASRPFIEAGNHNLSLYLPDKPIWLDADATRLSQVVSNLLNNSSKYTPNGGRIELIACCEKGDAVVQVRDNGVGIPSEHLTAVFDMFTQVNRTLDRAQGGLGIGLALVRKLMEMHGGSIRAESPGVDRGSTFTLRLPLASDQPTAAAQVVAPSVKTVTSKRRILVVDDNVDGAETLALLLEFSGHKVRIAHSGPEALNAAADFHPEVVFLDIGLPGMNGYEVAQRLRAELGLTATLLVALTGWGTEEDKNRARRAGFDFHLTKPVEVSSVEQLLNQFTA